MQSGQVTEHQSHECHEPSPTLKSEQEHRLDPGEAECNWSTLRLCQVSLISLALSENRISGKFA
jgi:hypothetical protein